MSERDSKPSQRVCVCARERGKAYTSPSSSSSSYSSYAQLGQHLSLVCPAERRPTRTQTERSLPCSRLRDSRSRLCTNNSWPTTNRSRRLVRASETARQWHRHRCRTTRVTTSSRVRTSRTRPPSSASATPASSSMSSSCTHRRCAQRPRSATRSPRSSSAWTTGK